MSERPLTPVPRDLDEIGERGEIESDPPAKHPDRPDPEEPRTFAEPVPVVDAKQVRCPYCSRTTRQWQYGRRGQLAYYECRHCVFPDGSGSFTKYKVLFS